MVRFHLMIGVDSDSRMSRFIASDCKYTCRLKTWASSQHFPSIRLLRSVEGSRCSQSSNDRFIIGDMGGVTCLHGYGVELSVIIDRNRSLARFWQWSIKNSIGESGVYLLMCDV